MRPSTEFIDYLHELMHALGEIRTRAMFGGVGFFTYAPESGDDIMFALVTDDVLYFKVDAINRGEYQQRNLEAFCYQRKGKPVKLSYHRAPEDVLDNPDEMTEWAEKAIQAARRNDKKSACNKST